VLEIADDSDNAGSFARIAPNTSAILRACSQKRRRRTARSSTSSTTMRSRWKRPARSSAIPQSTVKTRMFYARKQLADLLRSAGVDSLAA